MSATYTWIGWNRQKRIYDVVMAACIGGYLAAFVAAGSLAFPADEAPTPELLLIRGLGTLALLMLHVVLWIGPLARLSPRFLPLLYNRRHLGVTTFLVGLGHAALATIQYHGFADVNPLISLLSSNTEYLSLSRFPFETLGLIALIVLFLMAATSHDFWLHTLSPRVWKGLHMLVYGAYALLVLHVALGFLQQERHPLLAGLLGAGVVVTIGVHVGAGATEARRGRTGRPAHGEFIDVGGVDEIPESRALVVSPTGAERIAVFRHDGKVCAVSNVCAHQGGPLGEGKIVDGCITCPWHGYQYLPESGRSPAPFTERIPTYRVRVEGRRVLVDPRPLPAGTPVEPAQIGEGSDG